MVNDTKIEISEIAENIKVLCKMIFYAVNQSRVEFHLAHDLHIFNANPVPKFLNKAVV